MAADVASLDVATLDELHTALRNLTAQESELDHSLDQCLAHRDQLHLLLDKVDLVASVVSHVQYDAQELHVRIDNTAHVAERISGQVRRLDQEQSRVKESIDMLQAVQELKTAIASVHAAQAKQDWEAATRNMAKALAIDPNIVQSDFAEAVIPTSDFPLPPVQTLQELRQQLLDTFLQEFAAASEARDEASLSRYFKLFPLIGHSDQGLAAYSKFIATLLPASAGSPSSAAQSPMHFALALTGLFEQIALIIAHHQGVIEKYYGRPLLLSGVIAPLGSEYDRLALSIIGQWEEERRVDRRLLDVKAYRFPLLTTLSLAVPSQAGGPSPFPGAANLNMRSLNASLRQAVSVGPLPPSATPTAPQNSQEEELADTKEIDTILSELAQMSGRWHLFRKFLYARLLEEPEEAEPSIHSDEGFPSARPKEDTETIAIIEKSAFQRTLKTHLKTYAAMEGFYFRCALEKVHQLDTPDLASRPASTSALDDTFFIFKKVLGRLIATADTQALASTSTALRTCFERDWAQIFRKRMDLVSPNMQLQQSYRAEDQKREKEARAAYMAYLNNLDLACEYLSRLIQGVLEDGTVANAFFKAEELDEATQSLTRLGGAEEAFRSTIRSGIDQMFNQLVRPKIRSLILECYKDVSYMLDEDSYAEATEADLVRKRFSKAWDDLTSHFRAFLTESNYRAFFGLCVGVLVRPWEATIKGLRFTELGAIRFDRDLRNIISFLSNQTPLGTAALKDAFSRLQQIATLLNASQEDVNDLVAGASGWRLSVQDINSFLALRF